MKMHIAGAVAALAAFACPPAQAQPAASCDRACLSGVIDSYIAALKAHDPSKLQLAASVKFSENNAPLNLPDGLWNTVDQVRDYRLLVIDTEAGQVGLFTIVVEHGMPAILEARLKVVDRKVTELETVVLRPAANNNFGQPDAIKPRAVFYEDVPEAQRLSRTQMISIGNSYFETLQQNHGVVFAPFAPTCHRVENGVATTNNNAPPATGRPDPARIKTLGCEAQFKTGYFRFVTHIRDRRPLLVDRQKGLVMMAAFFDHQGDLREETLTSGLKVDPQFDTPWTWQIGEVFKVRNNQIDQVEAVVMNAPYGETDLWSDAPKWTPAH